MKTLLTLFILLSLTNCNAQKSKKMQLTDKEIKEKGYQIKKEDTIFMEDEKLNIAKLEKIGSSGSTIPPYFRYESYLDDGTYLAISGDNESGYSKTLKEKNGLFKTFYGYYPLGNLKNTGTYYIKKFNSGIRYYFDEQGKIEKYEDYDAPYEFGWEEVQKFLKEHKIKKNQIQNIFRGELDGVHGWEIIYKPEEFLKTDNVKVLTLDPKTGEILKEEIRDVSRQLD